MGLISENSVWNLAELQLIKMFFVESHFDIYVRGPQYYVLSVDRKGSGKDGEWIVK